MDVFETLGADPPEHCIFWSDPASGLEAILVLDDTSAGPCAGGIRTWAYPDRRAAIMDAARLARAMTLKCAISGLEAGGGKAVIIDRGQMDRRRAFEAFGRRVESLGGLFRTAGDLGTTQADLEAAAAHCRFVHLAEHSLAQAVARGMLRCIEACAHFKGLSGVAGLRVAVQGCGAIGAATARTLARHGVELTLADVDGPKALQLASELGARVVAPEEIIGLEADVLAPCALGGVLCPETVETVRAWAVCGGANNILTGPDAAAALRARGILHVPDFVSSAGAVIDGVGETVMGLEDRGHLIDRLGEVALEVLTEAQRLGVTPTEVAVEMATRRRARACGEGA